ncbi:MAG: hypothetical protein MOGMAGMI_00285 [Candidatus Omnitrophica bacterium]|nr:hypothetical protein [Candidatus Omnitrophota bacterium]
MSEKIEQEIEKISKSMENSTRDPLEVLKETIQSSNPEDLKKSIALMTESQLNTFKGILEEIKKGKAVSMDDVYAPKREKRNIKDSSYEIDRGDAENDKKLVKKEADKHDHQGDSSPEGKESPVIKATEPSLSDLLKALSESSLYEMIQKMCKKGYSSEVIKGKLVKKGLEGEKVQSLIDHALAEHEKEAHPEIKKSEEVNAPEIKKSEEKVVIEEKKQSWEGDTQFLLKANTLGRNFHFNVNQYLAEQEKESLKKSETKTISPISDILEKSENLSWDALENQRMLAEHQPNGNLVASFTQEDLARAFGMSVEELNKLLG